MIFCETVLGFPSLAIASSKILDWALDTPLLKITDQKNHRKFADFLLYYVKL